jgi:hypothetical protein
MKMWPDTLSHHLRNLAKYYELVIFTVLPIELMKKIMLLVPDLDSLIAHCLCANELSYNILDGPFIGKDLDLLAAQRKYKTLDNKLVKEE